MPAPDDLKAYFRALHDVHRPGDAREESYYPCLKDYVEAFGHAHGHPETHVTALPKATEAGNPDFRVWDGSHRVTGYIEAKAPSVENLDHIEGTDQLRRYLDTFPNLILTNFFEFRLYRDGQMVDRVLAAQPRTLTVVGAAPPPQNADGLRALLDRFFDFSVPETYTAESLAVELAKRTRFLRDLVADRLEHETDSGSLTGFYNAFQTFLIGHLEPEQFADLYAQTVTYGLFAARTRANGEFTRGRAYDYIPHTIGVLRDVFRFISLEEPPQQIRWIVDEIAQVLNAADARSLLARYYEEGKGSDPIVHFYETFLAEYDPAERERRGVYYTPEPVVDYIVRSLHGILKDVFGKADGLASRDVTLLDPAAGTMTFVARACRQAVDEFTDKYGTGKRGQFIREHILENFHAFELMMAPYAVGHLKIGFFLEELGHKLGEDERFKFYLTNTLDLEDLQQSDLPGMHSLAEESHLAGHVKKNKDILVILGNPPYSGHSTNTGEWITERIDDYKVADGKPLGEKNPKWLQDDYVKFLRFAQWKIDQAGEGVVGMITNHAWLDNPTFRGMRRSLMKSFDDIYVLDLHGNALKRETCPDGSPDENVFDIRQGVGIWFFVKTGEREEATIQHADLFGARSRKYDWLLAHDHASTEWQTIPPREELYLFVPRDETRLARYNGFVKVTETMPVNSVGIVTSRDSFVIDFEHDVLERRIRHFTDRSATDDQIGRAYGLSDKKNWALSLARSVVQQNEHWEEEIVECLYRPFDRRNLFYDRMLVERDRREVMRHMLGGANKAIVLPRRVEFAGGWQHVLCTARVVEHVAVSLKTTDYVFPFYIYPDTSKNDLFSPLEENAERKPNLHPALLPALTDAYGFEPTPEDVFHYVYAVLFAPTYREAYEEFLKTDFPRVPFTADAGLFRALASLGARLTALHLLESDELDPPAARFQGDGDGRVAKNKGAGFRYEPDEQRVYVNRTQYFEPVPADVWEYRVGGYQVCEKWLKDRRERVLTLDETVTYCRIVTALGLTIELQAAIDDIYPAAEEDVLHLTF